MIICITGASGFVGKTLYESLKVDGHRCFGVGRKKTDTSDVIISDLQKNLGWHHLPFYVDTFIHTAGRVHVMRETSADPLQEFRRVNVEATLVLARNAAASGVKRFVFISSAKVNGEATLRGQPFKETGAPMPSDPYAISKWEAEQGLAEIARQTPMEVVIIRPPLVYGPGVKANFASLMRAVHRGIPLPLKAIQNVRSLVGLDNLVDFISTCVTHPMAANQTFMVSDGFDVSTSELVRTMARTIGVADRQFSVPVPVLKLIGNLTGKAAVMERLCGNLQLDITKARTLLDWTPRVSFEEGIRKTMLGIS